MSNKWGINFQRLRACDSDWDESKHPRAGNGQFGVGGSGSKSAIRSNITKKPSVRYVSKVGRALIDKMKPHFGNWANLKLKKTGETVTVVKCGYASMENPELDKFNLESADGKKLIEEASLDELSEFLINRGGENHE